jgi:succinyl-CoA synthetase beta subunit
MAQRAIKEYNGKEILKQFLPEYSNGKFNLENRCLSINQETNLDTLTEENPWLKSIRLVAKPDQLIKRRGKNKLILLNATWQEAKDWIIERRGKDITIDNITGPLETFIIEPFIPHKEDDECYIAIRSVRNGDEILFYHQGGVNVGDVDTKAQKLEVGIQEKIENLDLEGKLLINIPKANKPLITEFIRALFHLYSDAGFTYLEINPVLFMEDRVIPLDLAAKLDDTAEFECCKYWGRLEFPAPFGRKISPEESYIRSLDEKTGASLKLTLLNPGGRVWTLVAGGGASVIYADTIADMGFGPELANYGEYSGNPNDEETYQYTKTVLDLMTREKDPEGRDKILLIGGGIANFTDVAKTFKGIIKALKEYREKLKTVKTKIFVRRGGPNYKEGLKNMRTLGDELGVPIQVYGPETHMTRIVKTALSA